MADNAMTIDNLQIRISATAKDATASLDALAKALGRVRNNLDGTNKEGVTATDALTKSLNRMNGALNTIATGGIKKLQKLANALNDYADACKKIRGSGAGITKQIQSVSNGIGVDKIVDSSAKSPGGSADINGSPETLGGGGNGLAQMGVFNSIVSNQALKEKADALKQMGVFASKAAKDVDKLGKETEKAAKKAKTATGIFSKFIKSIFRIALYRAIRSALKSVGEAFEEGLKNAYYYSKQTEGFERLANTLDRIASITYQMKNQLGAFWGEVKQFVLPAVEWLVEKVRAIAEWLTELFAALNGEDTYLYAKYIEKSWDDATDAAEKYRHQLLGIDELNNLSANKAKSGKDNDHSEDFEKKAVRESWRGLKDAVTSIKEMTIGIGDILFNWDDLNGEDIAKKIIAGIGGVLGGVTGFAFGGVPGAIVGSIAGVILGATIAELFFESNGDKYDKKKLRSILYPVLGAITGAWIGYKVSGLKGALVGMAVGATMGFVLSKLRFTEDGLKYGKNTLRDMIYPVLGAICGAWIGFHASGLTGALIGMSIGATLGLMLNQISFGNAEGVAGRSKDSLANQLIGSVLVGITGALIGWKVGGITGALVGASIGFTLSLLMNSLFLGNDSDDSTKSVTQKLVNVLTACAPMATAGFLTGWAVGGMAGALVGLTVGISLTLLIEKLGIDWGDYSGGTLNGLPDLLVPGKGVNTIKPNGSGGKVWVEQASGGINRPGTLILAGESGPEFVGSMGSNTAVANTQQMTDAIRWAAYEGMSQALKENGNNGLAGFVPATTDDLFIAMRKKASNYNKVTGNSAFA